MKLKKIVISTLSLMLIVGLVGCSKEESKEVGKPESTVTEVQSKLDVDSLVTKLDNSELLPLKHEMSKEASAHFLFSDIKDSIESGIVSQALINIQLQDVFVIEGKTEQDADKILNVLDEYKNSDSLRSFADGYGGEGNIDAMANSKLSKEGKVVYFIATPNADEIEKLILDNIGK